MVHQRESRSIGHDSRRAAVSRSDLSDGWCGFAGVAGWRGLLMFVLEVVDGFGSVGASAGAGKVHAVFHEVPAGAFDDHCSAVATCSRCERRLARRIVVPSTSTTFTDQPLAGAPPGSRSRGLLVLGS